MHEREEDNLNTSLTYLLNDAFLSDVLIKFNDNKVLYAHSMMLSLRSRIIQIAIESNYTEPMQDVISELFKSYSYDSTSQFLKFLYTNTCEINIDNFVELFQMAYDFEVDGLIEMCGRSAYNSSIHCLELLELGIATKNEKLLSQCRKRISGNFLRILQDSKFVKLNQPTLDMILELDIVSDPNEYDIFYCVMKWAKDKCNIRQSDEGDISIIKRKVLGDTLKLIRFAAMTNLEFATCLLNEPKLLTFAESTAIFINIARGIKNKYGFSDVSRRREATVSPPLMLIESPIPSSKTSPPQIPNRKFKHKGSFLFNMSNLNESEVVELQTNKFSLAFEVSECIKLKGFVIKDIPRKIRVTIETARTGIRDIGNIKPEKKISTRVKLKPFLIEPNQMHVITYTFLDSTGYEKIQWSCKPKEHTFNANFETFNKNIIFKLLTDSNHITELLFKYSEQ